MSRLVARRFLVLLSGTTAAQLLPVLTAPVIARSYSTAEFGVFGVYVAVAAICATVANLKYENVILSTRSHAVTRTVLGLSLCLSGAIGMLLMLGLYVAGIAGWLRALPSPALLAFFVPLSVVVAGVQQALSNVAFQREQFASVSRSRFAAAAVTGICSLIAALLHPTAVALIIASLAGQCVGVSVLASTGRKDNLFRPAFHATRMRAIARRHWRFAMYTSPADLLNALASNLPALSLGALYGTAATGAYVLAQRLLGTPLMLIGSAFADLYRQRVGQRAAAGQDYWNVSLRMLRVTAAVGALVLGIVLLFGRHAAITFLGAQWTLVGDICIVMVWVYVTRFIVSPLTFSFYLAHRHREDLLLQTLSVMAVSGAYCAAHQWDWTLQTYVATIAWCLSAMYAAYCVRSLQFSHQSLRLAPRG